MHALATNSPHETDVPDGGPRPPFSSVVITAASAQISENPLRRGCQPARTDLWTTPSESPFIGPSITGARIVLAAGDACSRPTYQLYPWPETATAPPAYDYRTALMWGLGQALGLADELASPSVRRPPSLGTFSRDLTNSDREVLRTTYGPIRSRPYWATSTDGITWRDRGATTLIPNPSLGVSMCALSRTFGSSPSRRFLVASADVSGSSNTVSVVLADENLANGQQKQSLGATNHPPRVACGASSVVVAFIDLNGRLQLRRSTDGVTWAPVTLPVLGATRVPPGIEFVPWKRVVLHGARAAVCREHFHALNRQCRNVPGSAPGCSSVHILENTMSTSSWCHEYAGSGLL